MLHQVADALEAIASTSRLPSVLLDGGMSRSDWIVQRLADTADVRVERAARGEATAIGAAMMAGIAVGLWDAEEVPSVAVDRVAEPSWSEAERELRRARWSAAVEVASAWTPEENPA